MLTEKRKTYKRNWYLDNSRGIRRRPARIIKPCAYCHKEISLQPNQARRSQHFFCCHDCYGLWVSENRRSERHPNWQGGRRLNGAGYIEIRLQPDDFFYSMQSVRHYVLEHRLIMAKHLKRCLLPWEVVHHINGIKDDNRLENLKLLGSNGQHNTMLDKWCRKLLKENQQLKTELMELKSTQHTMS